MTYKKITEEDIAYFRSVLNDYVFTDQEQLFLRASDETEDLHFMPEVVVMPGT